jgi:hypothetical protein
MFLGGSFDAAPALLFSGHDKIASHAINKTIIHVIMSIFRHLIMPLNLVLQPFAERITRTSLSQKL